MDRLRRELERAEERITGAGPHVDALGDQDAGIEAADRLETKKALLVDVTNEEADFVHVGSEHDAAIAAAAAPADEIAHGIDVELIDERLESSPHDPRDPLLVSGDTRCLAEPPQEFPVEIHFGAILPSDRDERRR